MGHREECGFLVPCGTKTVWKLHPLLFLRSHFPSWQRKASWLEMWTRSFLRPHSGCHCSPAWSTGPAGTSSHYWTLPGGPGRGSGAKPTFPGPHNVKWWGGKGAVMRLSQSKAQFQLRYFLAVWVWAIYLNPWTTLPSSTVKWSWEYVRQKDQTTFDSEGVNYLKVLYKYEKLYFRVTSI